MTDKPINEKEMTPEYHVDNDSEFVTWDELSTLTTIKLPLPKYGNKYVEFLSYIPLEDMAELQVKFLGNKKDYLGYAMAVLRAVMVKPAIKTEESFRALRHADSAVLYEIIGKVVSSQDAKDIENNLGNA